uniref:Guanylate cyclase 2G-like n=1 Tax=Saccoglossus kowalevskii TaxID=10224 RepID=A0ABM0MTT4_SACKO|nr:PREDICTED: guanylate cyclase 2G-like [Saccoglossus kowalevskii]
MTGLELLLLISLHAYTLVCCVDYNVLLSYPMTNPPGMLNGKEGIAAAYMIGFDDINADPNMLPGDRLTYEILETNCRLAPTLANIVDLVYPGNYTALIGPTCNEEAEPIASLSAHWDLPYMCAGCTDEMYSWKNYFGWPTMIRTLGDFKSVGDIAVEVFESFGWSRIGYIMESNVLFLAAVEGINITAEEHNFTVGRFESYTRQSSDEEMLQLMKTVSSYARTLSSNQIRAFAGSAFALAPIFQVV